MNTSISAVIPVYNSAGGLLALTDRLAAQLEAVSDEFEIILVNDGSRDDSWAVIQRLSNVHAFVRGINLSRNYGQHSALLCGIRAARHAVIVTLDDDLQNPPEEIPRLLEKLAEGHDVVYGAPAARNHGLMRNLASAISKLALRYTMDSDAARHVSPYRAFHRDIRDAFREFDGPYVSIDVLLTWGAERFSHITVRQDPRQFGASQYRLRTLMRHALNMLTGFSSIPLRVASVLGFLFSGVGTLLLAYTLVRYVVDGVAVRGFAFLAAAITLFSGVQLFSLGVIGEYIARIHFKTMRRPTYSVRSETRADAESVAGGEEPK